MRVYSNTAAHTYLTAAATSGATTLTVLSTAGWPTPGSDTAVGAIDYGDQTAVEVFTYTGKTSTTLTGVTRGQDGTSAAAHALYARVWHVASATDIANFEAHRNDVAPHSGHATDAELTAAIAAATAALSAHEADTTAVHGIADTSVLATATTLATAVSNHVAAGDPHTGYVLESDHTLAAHDTLGLTTDALLAAAVTAHESDTTSVHGVTDTAQIALKNAANTFTLAQTIAGGSTATDLLNLGADVNLYRSAANTLTTDDALTVTGVLHGANRLTIGGMMAGLGGIGAAIAPAEAGHKALVLQGYASQTADIMQLWNSSYTILTAFDAAGKLVFGPSGSQDTNLYRSAANTLRTNDELIVDSNLYVNFGDAGTGIYFGSLFDTNLYRSAANTLKTDDAFVAVGTVTAAGVTAGNLGLTAGGYIAGDSTVQLLAAAGDILYLGADADTGLIYTRRGMRFSAGKVLDWAGDTNLYRSAANMLKSDDDFTVGGGVLYLNDVAIFRQGASEIRVNASMSVQSGFYSQKGAAAQILLGTISSDAGITFGSAEDTNIYREAASVLRTDDAVSVLGVLGGKDTHAPTASLGETMARTDAGTNASPLSTGRIVLTAIWLPKGVTCTNITYVSATTALVAGTAQWFALYNSSLALLRQTVDDTSTAWAANTAKTLALTSTFVTTYSGFHYLAINVTAATPPTLRGFGSHAAVTGITPIINGYGDTGLTTTAPNPCIALTALNDLPYGYVS